jgi:hypothetical protein
LQAISRARREPLDFEAFELEVLELVVHYSFFYLEKRLSPKFGRMTKKDYHSRMKELGASKKHIRVGTIPLSSLINDKEMSKLVRNLERSNDS